MGHFLVRPADTSAASQQGDESAHISADRSTDVFHLIMVSLNYGMGFSLPSIKIHLIMESPYLGYIGAGRRRRPIFGK